MLIQPKYQQIITYAPISLTICVQSTAGLSDGEGFPRERVREREKNNEENRCHSSVLTSLPHFTH